MSGESDGFTSTLSGPARSPASFAFSPDNMDARSGRYGQLGLLCRLLLI